MAKFQLILVPQGAIIPEELTIPVVPNGNFIEKLQSAAEHPTIMAVGPRELQCLVEYRDLLDVDLCAIVGLHGTMYNTIWNSYVSTMKRTTVDALLAQVQQANNERADAGQTQENTISTRRAALSSVKFGDDQDDDESVGDIG